MSLINSLNSSISFDESIIKSIEFVSNTFSFTVTGIFDLNAKAIASLGLAESVTKPFTDFKIISA